MRHPDLTNELRLQGVPASPGIALGAALCFRTVKRDAAPRAPADVAAELQRLEHAFERSVHELEKIKQAAMQRLGVQGAAIFEAQLLMLRDESLKPEIEAVIRGGALDAESAVEERFRALEEPWRASQDTLMRERVADIEDLMQRVLRNLQHEKALSRFDGEAVIVAENLSPADTIVLSKNRVLAFAIDGGGLTSHAVIVARSLGIPAVIGLRSAARATEAGAMVIVDGDAGIVIVNPTHATQQEYEIKRERLRLLTERLGEIASLPATTRDNRHIVLAANLDRENEIPVARRAGAEGIGLVRTEILLAGRAGFPSEEEQYAFYKALAERMHPHWVTLRVFDIGADKFAESVPTDEQNPALGMRGIRLLLERKELFLAQLRAVLRASLHRNVRLLLPMIASVEEIWEARELIARAKSDLRGARDAFDEHLPLGVMVEIPSAALAARELAYEADFLSIGTNDLTQYTLAVDRTNDSIAHLYEEFHPATLRLIKEIAEAGRHEETPVAVCGELAGNPLATVLLAGIGIDELSVSTSRLLPVKQTIRALSMSEAERVARAVLSMRTAQSIRAYLNDWRVENERLQVQSRASTE